MREGNETKAEKKIKEKKKRIKFFQKRGAKLKGRKRHSINQQLSKNDRRKAMNQRQRNSRIIVKYKRRITNELAGGHSS